MNRLQKLLAFSAYQWHLLIASMVLLPIIKLSLNLFGFKKTYNRIVNIHTSSQPLANLDNKQLLKAHTIARMIDIAATHGFYRANCLPRSLLLMLELKKRKIPCQLMIGANEQGIIEKNEFGAHAWVKSGKHVLNGQTHVPNHFKAFPLPSGRLK